MQAKISPFLWFNGRAEEAMNFYLSVFKESERIHGTSPFEGVYVGSFNLFGQNFMVLDGGPEHVGFTEATSFMIHCEDQAEVDHYWDTLSGDGGKESWCGWLVDKFGVSWQVTPKQLGELMSDPDPEKAGRVGQAMMKMQKIIIADLEKAHRGE